MDRLNRRLYLLFRFFSLGFSATIFTSCSFLLYHPTHELHLAPEKLGVSRESYEDVYFRSLDGTALHSWYFHSQTHPAKAVVIFFHGNAENISSHYTSLLWMTKRGYDLFVFDYRGYGVSEGTPDPEGTVADGRAALRYASDRAIEKKIPMVVYLQSLGGAIGLRALTEELKQLNFPNASPNGAIIQKNQTNIADHFLRPSIVFAESTFHSYQEIGRDVLSRTWVTWIFQPLAYLVLSDRMAPEENIALVSPTPLVVIHGTEDPIVPYRFGLKVFELAKAPKTFWSIPGGKHIDALWRKDQEAMRNKVVTEIENSLWKK